MATLSRFLGLAPGHAGYSKIDVDVRIDAHADEGIRLAGDSRS